MSVSITIGPCPGCCDDKPCVIGELSCVTAGGTACLCGIEEYTSPSSPPKKYRTQTLSGSMTCCIRPGGCSGGITTNPAAQRAYSGTYVFNASTCAETNTQETDYGQVPTNPGGYTCYSPSMSFDSTPGKNVTFDPPCTIGLTTVTTQTSQTYSGTGICESSAVFQAIQTGQFKKELSNEDTEDDAIARLMAGAGFHACSGTPCCLAQWEARTTGFCFAYQDAIWTITVEELVPGKTYKVPVDFYDRPFGSGPYTKFEHRLVEGTADSFGVLVVSDYVPNQRGYQTYAVAGDCP